MESAKLEISDCLIDGGAGDVGDDEAKKDIRNCSFYEEHGERIGEVVVEGEGIDEVYESN